VYAALIRPRQQRRRDREAEGLGGLEADDELDPCGLFHGKIGWSGTFEDSMDVDGGGPAPDRSSASAWFLAVCFSGVWARRHLTPCGEA
jgi:hypothetical protein